MVEAIVPRKPQTPSIPGKRFNDFFYRLSRAEEALGRYLSIPFGGSLLVVARRSSIRIKE
jgi:hypothetical protein